jgi:hypothetical protein
VETLASGALADTGSRPSVPTDNFALPKCANHRSLSRPPSRRQPFPSESQNQFEKSVEKSIKFSRRLRVEFTEASSELTVLAQGANTQVAVA